MTAWTLPARALGLGLLLSVAALGGKGGRARHIALPVLVDPSLPAGEGRATPPVPVACSVEEVARVGHRVTALLPDGKGGLLVGTFDGGLAVAGPGGALPPAARALAGRRLMVNALAAWRGTIWAATQGGLVALAGPGAGEVVLADEAVSALAEAGGELYAGTGHGLWRLGSEGGAEAVSVTGPDGEALRVTALAAPGGATPGEGRLGPGKDLLWIGTSSGAYSLPLAALASPGPKVAAWHPLVFGNPPASTNVVTALANMGDGDGDGAVAGTDDGGLVRLGSHGEVAAVRLTEVLANQVNPGAAAGVGPMLAFGTQGGGLLLVRTRGKTLEVARPEGLAAAAVSALSAAGGGAWLVGTADGRVVRVACPD